MSLRYDKKWKAKYMSDVCPECQRKREDTAKVAIAGVVIITIGCLFFRIDGVVVGSAMGIIGWIARGKLPEIKKILSK